MATLASGVYTVNAWLTLSKTGTGSCTLTARQLKAGSYTLIATYGGSADYSTSASPSKTLKVLK